MYEIRSERRAERELLSLPRDVARRIALAIDRLTDDARPAGCRKISGAQDTYRIRVGRFRVVYDGQDEQRLLIVLRVAMRTESTYRGL
ncbi:MAG TPA: type II toxin-antitoxin system RelE/ParE family toxin [Dehalococcoidia bacterium]|nr:type II toxin-antitoxin system RelE/ParE family toxin [Dehalococcoidia bacterium]